MCESTVYIEITGKKKEFMKDVVKITFKDEVAIFTNILGERKELKNARIKEANLIDHNIVFELF